MIGRREGRNIFYRLSDAHVRLLLDVTREHITHHVPAQFENGPEAAGGPASVWTIGLIDPPDAFESSRP